MMLLHVEGASPAQLQRGIAAAEAYFAIHGLNAGDVWIARIKIEDEDIGAPDIELSSYDESIWQHWHEAEMAAKIACRGDGDSPTHTCLAWQADVAARAT